MKIKYETIKNLLEAVKAREIDEEKLFILLDNDCTNFYVGEEKIEVNKAGGYMDIEPLYQLLFPKALVEWC